jgi:hypothetical protein
MMKTRALAAALLAIAGAVAINAAEAEGKIYVGGKLAIADPDIGPRIDNAYTAGVYGGFNLFGRDAQYAADLGGGTFSAEGELMLTASKGKADPGKWDITSLGAYGVYRYPLGDKFYLKGRVGLVRYDINTTLPPASTSVASKTGVNISAAAGIGGGVKIGPGRIEADITTYESDILTYGVGFHMAF